VITPDKIEEWIREAEERPSSASLIIRFIGNRLLDLTKTNEELQTENLALRTEKKVEEFEERIANLEYQSTLLKRQLSGELPDRSTPVTAPASTEPVNLNLLIYNTQGQVLRIEKPASSLISGGKLGHISDEVNPSNFPTRILAVHNHEELLFAFDSGRTVTMPVTAIPENNSDHLDWQQSYLQAPLGTEELAFIQPVARMALYDYCIQISRKGCVKKIKEPLFESYVGKSYIGTGIKSPPDKTFGLVFSGKTDHIVLVSKEGYLLCLEIGPLPMTIEEVLRLNITDHIITSFTFDKGIASNASMLFVTQNGKVIHRHQEWLDVATSYKTKGQSLFSQDRRDAGVKLVGAALVRDDEWGFSLRSDGEFTTNKVKELIGTGVILSGEPGITILDFTTFQ
jgi:DNA gyrase/topoisomerase IV subunit A